MKFRKTFSLSPLACGWLWAIVSFVFHAAVVSSFLQHGGTILRRRRLSSHEYGFATPNIFDKASRHHNFIVVTPQKRGAKPFHACHRTAIGASVATVTRSLPSPGMAVLVGLASILLAVIVQRRRIFYPGSLPDPAFADTPLPPGEVGGCPFLGDITSNFGLNKFLFRASRKLGSPCLWKYYGFGRTIAVMSGSPAIKKFLGREFREDGGVSHISDFAVFGNLIKFLGNESMLFERDDLGRYQSMRRLVGQSMTPEAVAKSIATLQLASGAVAERVLATDRVVMEELCTDLTLDVAWCQIIGLGLVDEEEIKAFHKAAASWIQGIRNPLYSFVSLPDFIIKRVKPYKAKLLLTKLIERKIDDLEQNGPDGSTLSSMVFAVDEERQSRRLSRQQIIDNALLLIVAGTETSASTLANSLFLIGSHPGVWEKLVSEQNAVVKKFGDDLTQEQLENEYPYLDAVLKETMRLLPISGGGIRNVDKTIVMDDFQVPKGFWGMYSISLTHEQDPITWKEDGSHMDVALGFQPERWLNNATRPKTEFMPWGAGHRFCLGHTLATAEMKTFLSVLARRVKSFDLLTNADKVKWKEGIITTPKDGVAISAVSA